VADHEDGASIINNGYTLKMALSAVACDAADMVALGRPFISKPDLVNCLRFDEPLTTADATRRYGSGGAGYTDYPALVASDVGADPVESPRTLLKTAV
jgi:2,4-dienoyl-CoA reductase-like NADH-dependent reductase (Old Yellow Enzyme family)